MLRKRDQLIENVTASTPQQITQGDQNLDELMEDGEAWDMSVADTRALSNSMTVAQTDDIGQQGQNADRSSLSDTGNDRDMVGISSADMLSFERSFLDYPLDLNSIDLLGMGHENWDFGSPMNSQIQEQPNLILNGWLSETHSRMKTISQRLFPATSSAVSHATDAPSECGKVSANEFFFMENI